MIDIFDDETMQPSEIVSQGVNELLQRPKAGRKVVVDSSGGDPSKKHVIDPMNVPNSYLLLNPSVTISGVVSTPLGNVGVYLLGWNLTRESLLTQHSIAQ